MKTTSSIAFYCRASKCDKKGFAPIEISINIHGKRIFLNLPRKEKPDEFAKSITKRTDNDIKQFCEGYRQKVNELMTDLLISGRSITSTTLRDALVDGVMTTTTVSSLWAEYLKILKGRVGKDLTLPVYKKYEYVCERVIGIIGDVDIRAIGVQQAKKIQVWLYANYKDATAAGYLTKTKTVFRYAFDCGYISSNPFGQVKVKKGEPDRTYLTKEELAVIEGKVFDIDRLEKVRKLFLLECYTGMSYCDLQSMDITKIQNIGGSFVYEDRRQKTGIQYTSVFFPAAMDIIRGGIPQISNQKLNAYLKEIQDLCGIEKNLHSHLARHTYGHIMVCSGVNMTTIAHLMGHSSPTITAKIYAIPDSSSIVADAMKAFG